MSTETSRPPAPPLSCSLQDMCQGMQMLLGKESQCSQGMQVLRRTAERFSRKAGLAAAGRAVHQLSILGLPIQTAKGSSGPAASGECTTSAADQAAGSHPPLSNPTDGKGASGAAPATQPNREQCLTHCVTIVALSASACLFSALKLSISFCSAWASLCFSVAWSLFSLIACSAAAKIAQPAGWTAGLLQPGPCSALNDSISAGSQV